MKLNKRLILGVLCLLIMTTLWGCGSKMNAEVVSTEASKNTREQVLDTKDNSSLLIAMNETKDDFGSGFIVGKNTVVTAKHVVQNEESKDFKNVSIIYGLKDKEGQESFIKFPVEKVTYGEHEEDLAVIEVGLSEDGRSIGDVGKIATLSEGKDMKEQEDVRIIGYPGDKDYGTLWISSGKVAMKEGNLLTLSAYASGGNSGSPV